MILAIDTSSDTISIAFCEDGERIDSGADGHLEVRAEHTWKAGQQHSRQLLPGVQHAMQEIKAKLDDLRGVVVALGPGSFNGLRAGLSVAKGLSLGLSIPIVGVGTLEAWAYQFAGYCMPVRPITNAGRGEFNTALYELRSTRTDKTRRDGAGWTELEEPEVVGLAELIGKIKEPTFVCGDIDRGLLEQLRVGSGREISWPAPAEALRRAAYLCELGAKRLIDGRADDLVSLQPIYLRRPAITKSRRRDVLAIQRRAEFE